MPEVEWAGMRREEKKKTKHSKEAMKQTAGKGRAKALMKTYLFSLEDDNKCMVSVSYYSLLGKTPVKLMLML